MMGSSQKKLIELSVDMLREATDLHAGLNRVFECWFRSVERHYEPIIAKLQAELDAERRLRYGVAPRLGEAEAGRPGAPWVDARIMDP